MIRTVTGVLGVIVTATMALGAGFVLITETFTGYKGTAAFAVCLYITVIGVLVIAVYSVNQERLSVPYW